MKKLFFKSGLMLLIFIMFIEAAPIYAAPSRKSSKPKEVEDPHKEPIVTAKCAIAMDSTSNIVLFEKNADMLVPMASTTKIITALVALKYGNLDRKVEISQRAAAIQGSTVGYKKGELISIKELLYGLMLRSGNDAAIAISEGISGSVDEYVKLMNEYATEIGLCNTHFESPHGLDSDSHYTTAYDLALATAKAKGNKLFNEIVEAKTVDGKQYGFTRSYNNINKILWEMPGANGVKTGFTGNAGKCLVSSANVFGRDIIFVVLNCTDRWKQTIKIKNYVEKNYEVKKFVTKDQILAEVSIENSKEKAKLISKDDISLPVKIGENTEVKVIYPTKKVYAPLEKGDILGDVCIYQNQKLIYNKELQVKDPIEKKKFNIFR